MARRQRRDEVTAFGLCCVECGRDLRRTAAGVLACPKGHGKLTTEAVDDRERSQLDDPPQ